MKLLLDTHIFLWFISGDKRLPDAWKDSIRDPKHSFIFQSYRSGK